MDKGLLDLPSGPVQQNIDLESGAFSNTMLFGPDSFLNVSSSIALEVRSVVIVGLPFSCNRRLFSLERLFLSAVGRYHNAGHFSGGGGGVWGYDEAPTR